MIEIPINDDYMNRAREKASTVGILQGSITGCLLYTSDAADE